GKVRPAWVRRLPAGAGRVGGPPLGPLPLLALPLDDGEGSPRTAAGLLVVADPQPESAADLRWVARLLGRSLLRLGPPEAPGGGDRRLKHARALFQSVVNAVPDPILLTDPEGRTLLANARAEALFVAGEHASEGRRRAVALNNMFLSAALSQVAVGDAAPGRREILLVDPDDGSDLLFELFSAVVADPHEGTGIVSILHDVTDLRRAMLETEENYRRLREAEAAVRAERDRLTLVINSVADPILVTDPGGRIELMNGPAERLFTMPREGAGPEVERRVQANDAHFSSFVANLLASPERRWRGELGLTDPVTGRPLPVEAVAEEIAGARGEPAGIVTILHDRSEAVEKARLYAQLERASWELRRRVEEATAELAEQNELLRRQALELERASALKSQFLANVSHELRTPLNAVLGYTSMLKQGVYGALEGRQADALERVEANARHLLALINDLLDIARIESGKMPVVAEETSIPALLDEVMAEMEPLIARSRLDVGLDVAPGLPPVRTDRKKVKQIVINFLSNALKFTPAGSVRVTAAYDPARDEVAIAVADTGIGIAERDFEKIFEEFRQADEPAARRYTGTGLGLAICRRLAAMLEGRITLTSQLGKGSVFTLHLPRELGRP
ncbi:MAG TPA: ATP-binding protein, partial [Thermodesulfobacteriota bacterium]|nr:ATP-binding protein [Thermodesulfobacteriota bacterium]